MGVLRCLAAEGLDQLQMLRRIHQVVLAADHVGDLHFQVVDHVHKVEHVRAVRTLYHHVGRVRFIAIIDRHFAANQVVHRHRLALEAETPRAAVFIDAARGHQLFKPRVVNRRALALVVGAECAALFRTLVPVQSQPVHPVENRLPRLLRVPRLVGVLHPQHKYAAMFAGKQPVEQSRARASNVQIASGRRSKTSANGHGRDVSARSLKIQI